MGDGLNQPSSVKDDCHCAHQEIAPRNVSFRVLFVCSNPLFHDGKMTDCIPSDADLQKGFDGIPHFPGNE